jgi:hypothetical protein
MIRTSTTSLPFAMLVVTSPAMRQPMPGHRGGDDKLLWFRHHDDSRCPAADGGKAEHRLGAEPGDLESAASLMCCLIACQ